MPSATEKTKKKATQNTKTRTLKAPQYKSFRLSRKIKSTQTKPIPGIYTLFKQSLSLLKSNKKLFFGILAIYFVLNLFFVTGFGLSADISSAKQDIEDSLGDDIGTLSKSFALLGILVGSGNTASTQSGAVYQFFLTIIVSLVIIWAIRQRYAGQKISVKQSFYTGTYPLIPFFLVLAVIGLQMIPLLIGNFLISAVFSNGLAITFAEKLIWIVLFGLLATLSFYMVISSIFAMYIVTLPDMMPMKALRSARGLVIHRRVSIFLRLIGLPILMLLLFVIILLPIIYILPGAAAVLFIIMNSLALFVFHGYMYNLYRSLL